MVFEEFALKIIVGLLTSAIKEGVKYSTLSYFERRRIASRVEDATAEVVEPLIPFLRQEHISEDKQRRLIETCVVELRPLTKNPELLFQGSLNGQKIFEDLYANRNLPDVIVEDGLKDIYTLLCPRIAELLCKIPAAVKDWENEAWSENFRRFDDIAAQMRTLFIRVDQLATLPSRRADETLTRVRQSLAQKIGFDLDLTGLRADRPQFGKFEDFFVHPEIKEVREDNKERQLISVGTSEESFNLFTRKRHQAIIIGAPGAGKSTWTKWLQREALSSRWTGIAVRVELRGFSGETLPSLHELIRDVAGKHFAEELTAERISRWLDEKQIIFILDGFDEIRPTDRDAVYDWIVDLSTAGRGCPFILTSRPLTTDHLERLKKDWTRWTIEPFDDARIVDYIQRWYQFTPLIPDAERDVDAAALASNWGGDPTIGPLTGNPLLLSTLLMVHHLDGSLPSGRSQLYRRYVEGMLGLWDDRRKVTATSVALNLEQKRQILRALALHLFFNEMEQIDEPDALVWLKAQLQKMNISSPAEEVLAMLRERSGLIIGPGIYSFAHKSIAEYLVAETILQGDQKDISERRLDRFRLFEYRDSDRWNNVTFLWAGLAPIVDLESFINACIKVEAFALAAGLVADQYERLPAEIRRKLLLNILLKGESIQFGMENYFWICSHPANRKGSFPLPIFELRRISSRADLYGLVLRAMLDGTIVWSDCSQTRGTIKTLLWMTFAGRSEDFSQWKLCLKEPPTDDAAQIEWIYLALEWSITGVAYTKDRNRLETLLNAYKESCPHLRGLIPLALISVGLKIIFNPIRDIEPGDIDFILEALPGSDDGEVSDWLLETRDWVGTHSHGAREGIDLLSVFLREISGLNEKGILEANDSYDNAVKYVKELKARRDDLIAGSST